MSKEKTKKKEKSTLSTAYSSGMFQIPKYKGINQTTRENKVAMQPRNCQFPKSRKWSNRRIKMAYIHKVNIKSAGFSYVENVPSKQEFQHQQQDLQDSKGQVQLGNFQRQTYYSFPLYHTVCLTIPSICNILLVKNECQDLGLEQKHVLMDNLDEVP